MPDLAEMIELAEGPSMRLNRFLARAGIASRRRSEALIQRGAVRVNGEIVLEPWRTIRVGQDRIELQGRVVEVPRKFEYLMFYKPAGCLVTRRDAEARPTVFERIPGLRPGTVAVGRLDLETTGLLLLTDDGELAFRLMHPRYEIDKRYEVVVQGRPKAAALERLRRGVKLEEGKTAPACVEILHTRKTSKGVETLLTLTIREGRKRQVRRMFEVVGHPVLRLKRVAFAGLELDLARPGQWRRLTPAEVEKLKAQVGLLPASIKCPARD